MRHAASSALILFGVLGVFFSLLFGVIGPFVLPDVFGTPSSLVPSLQFAIVVFAVQVLIDQLTNAAQAALDGLQRVDLSRGVDAIRRTAVAATVAIVAIAGGGLQGVALASLAGAVVGAVASIVMLQRQERGWWRTPRRDRIRSLVSYGKAIAVLQPLGVITRQMDRLIAGIVLGPAAVTLVEIATQIQNGAYAVLSATAYAATPASSWVDARDEPGLLRELVMRGTKYSLLVTYPVAIGAAILAPDLVHVWVGPTYAAAAGLTVLALIDVVVSAPVQVGSNVLIGVGRAPDVVKAALGALAINLTASLILVHVVGTAGVFIGTLLAALFLVPVIARAGLRLVGIPFAEFLRSAVVPALVACIPMAAVALLVEALPLRSLTTIVIAGGVGGVVYVLAAALVALSADERRELRSMIRRPRPADEATDVPTDELSDPPVDERSDQPADDPDGDG